MAMACLVERAPCLPSRMWCISSLTNSPAAVEGVFPSRRSSSALSFVFLSGMVIPPALTEDARGVPGVGPGPDAAERFGLGVPRSERGRHLRHEEPQARLRDLRGHGAQAKDEDESADADGVELGDRVGHRGGRAAEERVPWVAASC